MYVKNDNALCTGFVFVQTDKNKKQINVTVCKNKKQINVRVN